MLEEFLAHKPVVTTKDAGGPIEFVENGVTGLVVDPEPEALGGAIARLADDHRLARSFGDADTTASDRLRGTGWLIDSWLMAES